METMVEWKKVKQRNNSLNVKEKYISEKYFFAFFFSEWMKCLAQLILWNNLLNFFYPASIKHPSNKHYKQII